MSNSLSLDPLIQKVDALIHEVNRLRDQIDGRLPLPEKNWTIQDAARKLGVSTATLWCRIQRGKIDSVKVDGRRTIPDAEVRRLMLLFPRGSVCPPGGPE
jgi:predicted DNA-binding protein (UPF0251 family)